MKENETKQEKESRSAAVLKKINFYTFIDLEL